MSTPATILDAQLQSLLAVVEGHREAQCRALRDHAEAECRRLLTEAYREGRARMHVAADEERLRRDTRLTAARAELQTRARHQQYRVGLALLEAGWPRLRHALTERWREPATRRAWIAALVAQALEVLPPHPWSIDHPADWSADELGADLARISGHCGTAPDPVPHADIAAGLRIRTGAACLDGTLEGLLVDRTAIEARLLAELNRRLGRDLLSTGEGTE